MYTDRIKAIASLVDKGATVLDIGTDHAYLPIYLVENKICTNVLASDISEKVLKVAKANILESGYSSQIKTILSDGIKKIKDDYDTIVIAGMGFNTIKKILKENINSDTIIIQTNSEHAELRKFMNENGFKIKKEIVIYDKRKYYVIIKYILGTEKLSKKNIIFGNSGNTDYYKYLLKKNKELLIKVPLNKKIKFLNYVIILNKSLKENRIN